MSLALGPLDRLDAHERQQPFFLGDRPDVSVGQRLVQNEILERDDTAALALPGGRHP